jgi:hypothetical protein
MFIYQSFHRIASQMPHPPSLDFARNSLILKPRNGSVTPLCCSSKTAGAKQLEVFFAKPQALRA